MSPQIMLTGAKELENEKSKVIHPNSPEEQSEVAWITKNVNEMYDLQNRTWREFNERTLKQWIDDNQKRVNNYVEPRSSDLDDWQTRGFEGITREKMFAFVSKVAMKRPEYKFKATKKNGFIDRLAADVINDFHDYTWLVEDPTGVEFFFDAWEAAGSGTVIRWEGVEQTKETVEEFDSYDVTTGEIKGLKKKTKLSDLNCKSRRVELKYFLISNWYEPDLQRQSKIAEIQILSRAQFDARYGNYKNAKNVPHMTSRDNWLYDDSFYMEQWSNVPEDSVHLTHFYSKENGKNRYWILANGVLILATPNPRKDGKYPYSRGIFKPFANSRFFYGKSLPDEIASDQDIYNAFKNMVIDRAILNIQRPMITDSGSEIEDDILGPNKILNIKGTITTLDIEPPNTGDLQILEYLRGAVNRQTSDSAQSGTTGKGVTAREIVIADENARKLAGVFRLFLEDFDLKATKLRVGNILQFYFEPVKIDEILSDDKAKKIKNKYRIIQLENKRLGDGKVGTKVVEVVGGKKDIPSRRRLDVEEKAAKLQGFEMQKVVITCDYIKNINLDVLILQESSFEQSRSLELAMENEYIKTMAMLFPDKFQEFKEVFFRELNEVYDKDLTQFETTKPKQLPQQMIPGMAQAKPGIKQNKAMKPGMAQAKPGIASQMANTQAPTMAQMANLEL